MHGDSSSVFFLRSCFLAFHNISIEWFNLLCKYGLAEVEIGF